LGMVEGTDPVLRNEVVVVGAHFDANGIDDKGLIYSGADDNGSGAVAVLAVAEAFAKAAEVGQRPKRTVVFALWNSEEKGISGSAYYVEHPQPAWGKVVVNVNIDHAGRNEENVDASDPRFRGFPLMKGEQNANVVHLLGYSMCPDAAKVVMDENASVGLDVRQDYDQHVSGLLQRSDQWPFLSKGIPAVFLSTGLHPDYHLPTDTIEKINFPKLEKIARLAFRTVWHLANQAQRPAPPKPAGPAPTH
jgi:Zn-dependent M28 family amino/carboxypeptidase